MDTRDHSTTVTKARHLLKEGERAIILPTRGAHLDLHPDGTGTCGYWKVSRKEPLPDLVIIYHFTGKRATRRNTIMVADPVGLVGPDEEGKYAIQLLNVRTIGLTLSNWREFADTYRNTFAYIERTDNSG